MSTDQSVVNHTEYEACVQRGGLGVAVAFDRRDSFSWSTACWHYWIYEVGAANVILCEGTDLRTPVERTPMEALAVLLDFLSAWVEGGADNDNLFPKEVREIEDVVKDLLDYTNPTE